MSDRPARRGIPRATVPETRPTETDKSPDDPPSVRESARRLRPDVDGAVALVDRQGLLRATAMIALRHPAGVPNAAGGESRHGHSQARCVVRRVFERWGLEL